MNSTIIKVKPLSFLVYTITIIIKGVVAKLDAYVYFQGRQLQIRHGQLMRCVSIHITDSA
jgi:hypothetical protein